MKSASLILAGAIALMTLHYSAGQGNTNPCTPQVKCSDCIQSGGNCAWCGDEDFRNADKQRARCDFVSTLQPSCNNLSFPISDFTPNKNDALGPNVLLQPQSVQLKLRPGRPSTFTLSARPAENYPVDLYYLMDLSASMRDDLSKLKELGTKIANAINNVTTKYRLGFGSFVDKTVSPIVQIEATVPCSGCVPTYGFRHSQSFSNNANDFAAKVQKAETSGNLDTPEGGFDAMMQMAVCETQLGWGDPLKTRRIVVYVSDASFHVAGDGKIGGIVTPNDAKCYLNAASEYSRTNLLDYPSVGLLKKILKEKKIVPILAVTEDHTELYEGLVEEWKELGATAGTLTKDSSNVVTLISNAYKKISSTVTLNDDSKTYIQVDYSTKKCSDGSLNECRQVAIGETVEFEISVTATPAACDAKALAESKNFQIQVPAFGDINVDVEVLCECQCEKPPLSKPNSPKCFSGNGTYECGQCTCNPGRFGENCGCTSAESVDEASCRSNPNDTNSAVCSSAGTCICGKCECDRYPAPKKVSGRFCQCTNFNCERDQGKICGGVGHGRCECSKCICEGIWIGSNCGKKNCTKVERDCYKDGLECGGHGKCNCGVCSCDADYSGKHCENCPTCPGQCLKIKDCILCRLGKNDPVLCANCTMPITVTNETINEKCRFQDSDGCFFIYTYELNSFGNLTYTAQENKKCYPVIVEEPNVLAIVLGTIGGIVLAGLIALLLWKLFVSAYDKFEYHKFEKERTKSKWEKAQNPLYKPSKQKYENPAYVGNR